MGNHVLQDGRRIPEILGAALGGYITGARRTGRTTNTLLQLKDGDVMIFSTDKARTFAERQLYELREGKPPKVLFVAAPPTLHQLVERMQDRWRGQDGQVHFDHTWYEAYYESRLKEAANELGQVVNALEGYREPSGVRAERPLPKYTGD